MKFMDLLEKLKVVRDYRDKYYRAGQEDGYQKGRWVRGVVDGAVEEAHEQVALINSTVPAEESSFIQELKEKTAQLEQITREIE